MWNNHENRYTNITTGGTNVLFTGRGNLHNIVINTTATGVVRIVDNTTGTTANVGLIDTSKQGPYLYDACISKGLIIDTGGSADITVMWSQ